MFHNDRLPSELILSQLSGCQCRGLVCTPEQCDCLKRCNGNLYDSSGRLSCLLNYKETRQLQPVFECNSCCACPPTCPNRLVQHLIGRFPDLKVVNTGNADKGLGIICQRDLSPGQFVCLYMGEYIPPADAGRVSRAQILSLGHTYILCVREFAGASRLVSETVVDGAAEAFLPDLPISSYINHSCQPNLTVVPVRVDSLLPFLTFFANQKITAGTELTYDYGEYSTSPDCLSKKPCQCGELMCRGFLPGAE
ncbi:unnamed protein product [Dibothriocephalus latus]|uniref:Histone-lysine N-methyltransferase n=1 Tax=Dibothriocephalus latus TaxID=60516 RepID=A0A3P7MDU9_DIBLA|nr:unnamed protein product [Dibothriocephalus latus]